MVGERSVPLTALSRRIGAIRVQPQFTPLSLGKHEAVLERRADGMLDLLPLARFDAFRGRLKAWLRERPLRSSSWATTRLAAGPIRRRVSPPACLSSRERRSPRTVEHPTRGLDARLAHGELTQIEVVFGRDRPGAPAVVERPRLLPVAIAPLAGPARQTEITAGS
ncbi:MAG: hypothetical protein KGK10_13465 [Rhodospirillales bacterium]|nr:hypothetical protein [Rhodospirillales bacterium]